MVSWHVHSWLVGWLISQRHRSGDTPKFWPVVSVRCPSDDDAHWRDWFLANDRSRFDNFHMRERVMLRGM